MLTPWKESYYQPRQNIKKQRHYFANKGLSSQGNGFSSGQVCMWELDYKESWALKNWCFWKAVLEKTLESPLDCKEIQPVHPKGDQSRVFIEGLMLKLKLQYFGHLMWRADSLEKTLMLGKNEGRRGRGWQSMRWLDDITYSMDMSLSQLRELVMGQGSLACCGPWGRKESDTTEWLNWTELSLLISGMTLRKYSISKNKNSFNCKCAHMQNMWKNNKTFWVIINISSHFKTDKCKVLFLKINIKFDAR